VKNITLLPNSEAATGNLDSKGSGEQIKAILRRCRGRPRLSDSDRAQRRLESRKKYDVRRVYLGESHKVWSDLRRRTSLSDAGLAEYLILLNSTYGERYQQKYGKKVSITSLQSLVSWYQEHCQTCPHEPELRAVEPRLGLSTSVLWQCEAEHSFVQHISWPAGGISESEVDDDAGEEVEKKRAAKTVATLTMLKAESGTLSQEAVADGFPVEEVGDLKAGAEGGCGTVPEGYECVVVTAALADRLEGADGASLVSGCEESGAEVHSGDVAHTPIAVLIIITGPSYEALTSEGIQLNMGGGDVEEVTCTVIEGVAYNQMCQPGTVLRSSIPETDAMTGVREINITLFIIKAANQTFERFYPLQKKCVRYVVTHSRSKRSRRGPVIEADGMLKMFHCPYEGCSQVYVAISSFQNHVNLVHRKGRTKVCPHPGCGKKFYLSNHLHRHMIIHSGVRDFICETCGKSFKRKNHLEVHRRTHTGETPLQCEICGYQCRQRASLNWHMKKHTTEAQYNYTCEHCGKRFEKLDSVKFHKLKSHPDKQTT
uniref:Zinc finger protein 653 n=1 Tax=Electrophorus electricus TaxID=8005 RepID=A0A4W4GL41_ELEEL